MTNIIVDIQFIPGRAINLAPLLEAIKRGDLLVEAIPTRIVRDERGAIESVAFDEITITRK
ncbi:MAG: hypothetical protein AB1631_17440 [Acidobacteriota bacterium]